MRQPVWQTNTLTQRANTLSSTRNCPWPPCSMALAVQMYLKIDRVDQAEKTAKAMSAIDDDSTLSQLAGGWVGLALVSKSTCTCVCGGGRAQGWQQAAVLACFHALLMDPQKKATEKSKGLPNAPVTRMSTPAPPSFAGRCQSAGGLLHLPGAGGQVHLDSAAAQRAGCVPDAHGEVGGCRG